MTDPAAQRQAHRASSFGAQADAYHQYRPGYPGEAIAWALGEPTGRLRVLDLAAGTGKLTEGIFAAGHEVIAVEPDPGMRGELSAQLPEVSVLAGAAEAIPLPDEDVDAVLVGQALHWFDPQRALPEIGRVLRPGGVLASLRNDHDEEVEWVRALQDAAPRPGSWNKNHQEGIPPHSAFGDHGEATFRHTQRHTIATFLATNGTHSDLLVAGAEERKAVLDRIESYLRSRPETATGEFVLPLRTTVSRAIRQ